MHVSLQNKNKVAIFAIPALHLFLCIFLALGIVRYEGSWGWFIVFMLDFPLSAILMVFSEHVPPLLLFGVFGTLWWLVWSYAIVSAFARRRLKSEAETSK